VLLFEEAVGDLNIFTKIKIKNLIDHQLDLKL
jgi:hypothetical protein